MKNMSRSMRRHHSERYFNKCYNTILQSEHCTGYQSNLVKRARKTQNNRKNCSCPMCCNERHNRWLSRANQLTLQERRNLDKAILDE